MPKLKDIALGLLVAPVLIPIMMIASYQDHKAIKKRLDEAEKKKGRNIDDSQGNSKKG